MQSIPFDNTSRSLGNVSIEQPAFRSVGELARFEKCHEILQGMEKCMGVGTGGVVDVLSEKLPRELHRMFGESRAHGAKQASRWIQNCIEALDRILDPNEGLSRLSDCEIHGFIEKHCFAQEAEERVERQKIFHTILEIPEAKTYQGTEEGQLTTHHTEFVFQGRRFSTLIHENRENFELNGRPLSDRQKSFLAGNINSYQELTNEEKLQIHNKSIETGGLVGQNIVHAAAMRGDTKFLELLTMKSLQSKVTEGKFKGFELIQLFAYHGNVDGLKYLKTKGIALDRLTADGPSKGMALAHLAAAGNRVNVLRFLVEEGIPIDTVVSDGPRQRWSSIQYAVSYGSVDALKFLIELGIPWDEAISDGPYRGETIDELAARNDRIEVLKLLVSKGLQLDRVIKHGESTGRSLVHIAAMRGRVNVLKFLFENGVSLSTVVTHGVSEGLSPIHFAAGNGHIDTVKYLMEKGISLGTTASDGKVKGFSAAHFAARHDQPAMLDYLERQGCLPSTVIDSGEHEGYSAIDVATICGSIKALEHFKNKSYPLNKPIAGGSYKGLTPVALVRTKKAETFKFFEKQGFSLSEPFVDGNYIGWTLAHFAASEGEVEMLKLLDQMNVPLDRPNLRGLWPIDIAVRSGKINAIEFFVGKGFLLERLITDGVYSGLSLMELAARFNQVNVLKYLKRHGLSLNRVIENGNERGYSLAHIAARHGAIETLKYLDDEGLLDTVVGEGNFTGLSPVHISAGFGQVGALDYFRQKGIGLNTVVDNGKYEGLSPVHISAISGQVGALEYFHQKGIGLNTVVGNGQYKGLSPVHMAARHSAVKSLEYLHGKGIELDTAADDGAHKGLSPVHISAVADQVEALEYFKHMGIGLETRVAAGAYQGLRPLDFAAINSKTICTEYLAANTLEERTIPDGPNQGMGAECFVIEDKKSVGALIQSNFFDVNTVYATGIYRGFTPLHLAIATGNTLAAKELLENGADPTTEVTHGTYTGLNAYGLAIITGHADMLNQLNGVEFSTASAGLFEELDVPHLVALSGQNTYPKGFVKSDLPEEIPVGNKRFSGMTLSAMRDLVVNNGLALLYEQHEENESTISSESAHADELEDDVGLDESGKEKDLLTEMASLNQGPKLRHLTRVMKRLGWVHRFTNGSHQQWQYPPSDHRPAVSVTLVNSDTRVKPYQVQQVVNAMKDQP